MYINNTRNISNDKLMLAHLIMFEIGRKIAHAYFGLNERNYRKTTPHSFARLFDPIIGTNVENMVRHFVQTCFLHQAYYLRMDHFMFSKNTLWK